MSGLLGIIAAHVLLNVPFACYLLYSAYQKIDWLTMWAAADLGAPLWDQYKDTILVQIKPALIVTSLTIFLLCFSSFSIPRMLGTCFYHYTPDVMLFFANKLGDTVAVRSYFFLRLLIVVPLGLLYKNILHADVHRQSIHVSYTKKPIIFNPYLHGIKWVGYVLFMLCIFGGPLIALLLHALRHGVVSFLYKSIQLHIDPLLKISVGMVIKHSLVIAIVSSIGSLILGGMLASLQVLAPNNYLRVVMHVFGVLPFILGNVVSGMLCAEGGVAFVCSPRTAIIISHIMLNYPFVYRFIIIQLYAYPVQLNQLAQSVGAAPYQIFRTVLLPFVSSVLGKAWSIAFGLSLVEVGAGAVVADGVPITMSLAMRLYYSHGQIEGVLGLSGILLIMVGSVSYLMGRIYDHYYS